MASAFSPVLLNVASQVQPWHVYARIYIDKPRVVYTYSIPYGFNFLARRIVARWQGHDPLMPPTGPRMQLEIYIASSTRTRTPSPVPFAMISSPCDGDIEMWAAPLSPGGVTFTAAAVKSTKILNIPIPHGDAIRAEITGWSLGFAAFFIDVVFAGYLIPEAALEMWRAQAEGADRE